MTASLFIIGLIGLAILTLIENVIKRGIEILEEKVDDPWYA